jgi:hypothetical protein
MFLVNFDEACSITIHPTKLLSICLRRFTSCGGIAIESWCVSLNVHYSDVRPSLGKAGRPHGSINLAKSWPLSGVPMAAQTDFNSMRQFRACIAGPVRHSIELVL